MTAPEAAPTTLHVLFVDDEPRVLEGLERMMFDVAEDWIIETACGGQEALKKLAAGVFHVVVSDMRMPGMDGATLLTKVAESYPHTIRVILSGQTAEEAKLRAACVAHRFLGKPCAAETIYEVIRRTHQLAGRLSDPRLAALVARLDPLPTPPSIYFELTEALGDAEVPLDTIAAIVSRDPALCAKTLQVANSSFFCRAGTPVANVRQALSRIGTRIVRSLALGAGIFGRSPGGAVGRLVERMQQHATRVSCAAFVLAGGQAWRDDAFAAGLMHDIGLLALAAAAPESVSILGTNREAQADLERGSLGASHAEIGAHLLDLWGLPRPVVEAVFLHETPQAIPLQDAPVAAAVHVATALVDGRIPHADVVAAYRLGDAVASFTREAPEGS
jgi:HD-like signal output (HDOD) protein